MILLTFGNAWVWLLGIVLLTFYAMLRWHVGQQMTDDRRYWMTLHNWLRPERPSFEVGWWAVVSAAFLLLFLSPVQWLVVGITALFLLYWAWVGWFINRRPRISRRRHRKKGQA